MANSQGMLKESIWRDRDFRALPRTAQATYAQLISQKELDRAGVQPLMLSKWVKGCDEVTEEDFWRDLRVLQERRFVFYDTDSHELFIRSYMRACEVVRYPNILKNALRCAGMVASERIRFELAKELRRLGRAEASRVADTIDPEGFEDPSGTVPEPFDNGSENLTVPEPSGNPSGTVPEPLKGSETPPKPQGMGTGTGTGSVGPLVTLGGGPRETHDPQSPAEPHPPSCPEHPDGPDRDCDACITIRRRYRAEHTAADIAPPARCPRHLNDPDAPNCGACAEKRRARERWDAEHQRRIQEGMAQERRRTAAARGQAIDACPMCDADGYLPSGAVCPHDRDRLPKPGRAAEAAARARCRDCDDDGRLPDGTTCDHQPATQPDPAHEEHPSHA